MEQMSKVTMTDLLGKDFGKVKKTSIPDVIDFNFKDLALFR